MSDIDGFDKQCKIIVTYTGLMSQEYQEVILGVNQKISQLAEIINLPSTESVLPVVNGRMENWDYILNDGDYVHLVQVISGG